MSNDLHPHLRATVARFAQRGEDRAAAERLRWLEEQQSDLPGPAMAWALGAGIVAVVALCGAGAFYVGVWIRLAIHYVAGI